MLTTLATILIGALVLLAAMVGSAWWRQERIAYQPPAERPSLPLDVRKIEFVAADHQPLLAYVVEPDDAPRGVLISFHGNADLAAWQIPWGREVARRTGWCIVLAEYRGYDGLGGMPTYATLRTDAHTTWREVQRFSHDQLRLTRPVFALFGHSLGSAIASELASVLQQNASIDSEAAPSEHGLAALVLQSPFTSARDMVRIVSTRPVQFLWQLIARVHYDTRARLSDIVAPIWIAHGSRDWLVPVSMGRELFSRARSPGRLLIVDGAGHNDVPDVGGEAYWQWLSEALTVCPENSRGARLTRRTEMSG